MTWWKPSTWKQSTQLIGTGLIGITAYSLQSTVAFYQTWHWPAWLFFILMAIGAIAFGCTVWLPLRWKGLVENQNINLHAQVTMLERNRDEQARQLMRDYVADLFDVSDYLHIIGSHEPHRRPSFEEALKGKAVAAAEKCTNDIDGIRIAFFDHFETPAKRKHRLACQPANKAGARGVPDQLVSGVEPGKYVLENAMQGKPIFEPDLTNSKEWPQFRDFHSIVIHPVLGGSQLFGIITLDTPVANSLTRYHSQLLAVLASSLSAGISMCRDGWPTSQPAKPLKLKKP